MTFKIYELMNIYKNNKILILYSNNTIILNDIISSFDIIYIKEKYFYFIQNSLS